MKIMLKRFPFVLLCLISTFAAHAEYITVHNKSNIPLYARTYYVKNHTANSVGSISRIEPKNSLKFARPSRKLNSDRKLIFSPLMRNLPPELSTKTSSPYVKTLKIGLLQGSNFYLTIERLYLKGYNSTEWYNLRPLKQFFKPATIQKAINPTIPQIKNNPYKDKVAFVRHGNNLCKEEQQFRTIRKNHVKISLEKLLKTPISYYATPTISLVLSGGGIRAMVASLGTLVGLKKSGLLDTITYISSLSGSTWAVAPWMNSNWPIEDIREALIRELPYGLSRINPATINLMSDTLLTKLSFNEPITLIDLYGLLLANSFLQGAGTNQQRIYLSQQRSSLLYGKKPFPIYTAMRGDFATKNEWYEFTPYEIGGAWLGHYVPTWAYGRKFDNGVSLDFAPEQTTGFQMGTFGAAFATSFTDIYNYLESKISSKPVKYLFKTIKQNPIGRIRPTAAKVFNFTRGMLSSPLKNYKYMRLVDAGHSFNLPYPPISGQRPGRKSNIIIFMDASNHANPQALFRKMKQWAAKNNIPFPSFNTQNLEKKSISIFHDTTNLSNPMIIYLPLIKKKNEILKAQNNPHLQSLVQLIRSFDLALCRKKTCSTLNFSYPISVSRQLSGIMEFNVLSNKNKIISAIKNYLASHTPKK